MDAERLEFVEEEIDLRHYIGLLKRHYKLLFSVTAIAASLALIYAFKLPNIYQAENQVLINKNPDATSYMEFRVSDPAISSSDAVYYNTQLEILQSPQFLSRVVKEFNLLDALLENRKSAKDLPEEVKLKTAAGMVKSGLSIQRIKETRIFTLTFKSTNPLLSKEVVNAVAQGYVKQQVEEKLYIPKELLQFFPEDADKIQVDTAYGQLQQVSQQDVAKTLPSVVNDPLIRQLNAKAAEAEARLLNLRETYKSKHPKVVEAKSTLKFIKDRIKIEIDTIVRNLKTTLTSQLQVTNVRILKQATVPDRPVGPKRMQMVLMTALGAFALCAGIVFGIDFMDDSIKGQEDIERFVQLPFLGNIPLFKEKIKDLHQKAFFVHYKPLSDVSECFRFIKVAINFSGAPGSLKCILLTSSVPSEGKSLVSANLISSFLRDGEKSLLVDADLRHPTAHLLTNTDNLKGLSNYLATNMEFEEVVQKSPIPQLDVIAAGPLSPNPTELFSSYRMENFIREAKSRYDRILIDSPPVVGLADSLVIGTKCDGVIFLIQARHISRNLIKKAKQRMLETGLKVLGVIINKVDLEREDPAYRYFTQGYYHGYGKKHKEKGSESA